MENRTLLAIDPGSSKCGLAIASRNTEGAIQLIWRAIAPTQDIEEQLKVAREVAPFSFIVVGSGTTSAKLVDRIRALYPAIGVLLVNEKDTTLQARERYWIYNPRRGWRKLLPASLQVPPEPYDDFAAFVLAERVLSGQ